MEPKKKRHQSSIQSFFAKCAPHPGRRDSEGAVGIEASTEKAEQGDVFNHDKKRVGGPETALGAEEEKAKGFACGSPVSCPGSLSKSERSKQTSNEEQCETSKAAAESTEDSLTGNALTGDFVAAMPATASMAEDTRSSGQKTSGSAGAPKCKGVEDLSSVDFDPSTVDVQTITVAGKEGPLILFEVLANAFDKIEGLKGSGVGSKKVATTILTNVYRLFIFYCPSQLAKAVYLSLNKVCPDYMGVEIGVGESLILKAIVTTYGRTEAMVKKDIQKYEDLGAVAAASCCRVRTLFAPPRLTVEGVFKQLNDIAHCSGQNSQQGKRDIISKLLVSAKKSEPKYLVRFLQQRMRIGVQTATVYQALAAAFVLTRPADSMEERIPDVRIAKMSSATDLETKLPAMEKTVRACLCELPNIELMIDLLLAGEDEESLPPKCVITPGIPVMPMLARPTKGLGEVFDRFSNCRFTCEFKYDGERGQIHVLPRGEIKIFSRNLENLTEKYPDLIETVKASLEPEVTDCIIDSEVVAYDLEADKILPFQVLTTRKRKDVDASAVSVQVCLFPFDCMRYNGESLVRRPLAERRGFLYKSLKEIKKKIQFAKHKEMSSIEEVDVFLQEAVEGACEGLMVKTLDDNASYEPSKRSLNWLKVKKDYIDGSSIADSLDLVPIGAFYGKGKRSKGYGVFLLAVWNAEAEVFQTVCKAGTGFSEEALQEHFAFLSTKQISGKKSYYQVDERMYPDVWFEACQVWECRAADLSLSPIHTAAIGDKAEDKGIGLRFPRFLRIRPDKTPEEATTSQQVMDMYESQFAEVEGKVGACREDTMKDGGGGDSDEEEE